MILGLPLQDFLNGCPSKHLFKTIPGNVRAFAYQNVPLAQSRDSNSVVSSALNDAAAA
jgi:hypothetical protein